MKNALNDYRQQLQDSVDAQPITISPSGSLYPVAVQTTQTPSEPVDSQWSPWLELDTNVSEDSSDVDHSDEAVAADVLTTGWRMPDVQMSGQSFLKSGSDDAAVLTESSYWRMRRQPRASDDIVMSATNYAAVENVVIQTLRRLNVIK